VYVSSLILRKENKNENCVNAQQIRILGLKYLKKSNISLTDISEVSYCSLFFIC
jgi:hypothetical protein